MIIIFFEAYKRLDHLCGDIFKCYNGVSEYISEMERRPEGQYEAAFWYSDYKTLKHVRWVRNQIAHNSSYDAFSDEDDLNFVEQFYFRIMNQDDPLARLREKEQRRYTPVNVSTYAAEPTVNNAPDNPAAKSATRTAIITVWLVSMFLIMMFLAFATC